MRRHPQATAGDLTWMRQAVVSGEACASAARDAGLGAAMVAAAPHGARTDARRLAPKLSIQAELAEAVIGGAWLDLGREHTTTAVLEAFADAIADAVPGRRDPKSALQEEAARHGRGVAYELVAQRGPAHARTFVSRALIDGRQLGEGTGSSKQASEIAAAVEALERLRAEEPG